MAPQRNSFHGYACSFKYGSYQLKWAKAKLMMIQYFFLWWCFTYLYKLLSVFPVKQTIENSTWVNVNCSLMLRLRYTFTITCRYFIKLSLSRINCLATGRKTIIFKTIRLGSQRWNLICLVKLVNCRACVMSWFVLHFICSSDNETVCEEKSWKCEFSPLFLYYRLRHFCTWNSL